MQAIRWSSTAATTALSVGTHTPAADVVMLLTRHQVRTVDVVDGYGVPVGTISLADLLADDETDPIFAGLARRRWYALPAGATAGALMVRVARTISRRHAA